MNSETSVEKRLETWMGEGPATAPDHVLDGILAAVPSTSRSRTFGGWTRRFGSRSMALSAGLAAVVIAVAGLTLLPRTEPGAGTGPTASPTAASTPPDNRSDTSSWTRFTSGRLGYSFRHPAGWYEHPATGPWLPGSDAYGPESGRDGFESNGTDGFSFTVASQQLPGEFSEGAWLTDHLAGLAGSQRPCAVTLEDLEPITIDGRPARMHGNDTSCGSFEAITFVADRVYLLRGFGFSDPRQGAPMSREYFEALLSTVRFDPASADDRPAP